MIEGRAFGALLTSVVLALCLLSMACGPAKDDAVGPCAGVQAPEIEPPSIDLQDPGVSRENLRAWVELLTSPRLRGRHAGEDGGRQAAALVAAQMARIGLVPSRPRGTPSNRSAGDYCWGFPFLDAEDYNVVGVLPGTPPSVSASAAAEGPAMSASGRVILVSAHYDGQGVHPAGRIYPGADDNASGVAALLEIARLVARQPEPRAGWEFAAFGAEEGGRQGSRAYLSAASALPGIKLAINLDMVGRPWPGGRGDAIGYLAAGGSPPATVARLRAAAGASGLEVQSLDQTGELMPAISDAAVLATRLPTLLLSTALHEDHHQLSDTPEKIDYEQIERAVRLVLRLGDMITSLR